MNKIYLALSLGAVLAACSTDTGSTQADAQGETNFAKINVIVGTLEDARDGKSYKTVQINDQVWMAENLNYAIDSSFCAHGIEVNCEEYGRLYKWADVMDSSVTGCGNKVICDLADSVSQPKVQGICPEGWHVPSDAEWDTLIKATGDVDHAAKALKTKSAWGAYPGADVYKFNVHPTGYRRTDGDFDNYDAYFWTSTETVSGSSSTNAWARYINNDDAVIRRYFDKRTARSVRCIKD